MCYPGNVYRVISGFQQLTENVSQESSPNLDIVLAGFLKVSMGNCGLATGETVYFVGVLRHCVLL